jgi:CheY-like chemotaxis protein
MNKRKLKVMIIEDEQDILVLLRDYLSGQGHEVVSCYLDANNILTDFNKNQPDICLIDYKLPGNKNGIEAAIEILNKHPSIHNCTRIHRGRILKISYASRQKYTSISETCKITSI